MAIRISKAMAISGCDHLNAFIDADVNAGTLIIYSGARPAAPETAVTSQVALVKFEFGDPAFGAAVDANGGGHATANAIAPVVASATGTATWFRIYDGAGTALIDGSVTDTGGNGDLKLSATSIVSGIDVTVVSLTTTLPASAA